MDSTKTTYATFPFEWTVKSTSYQIRYRKAENINEIDEIFCLIINAKGNQIEFLELGNLLGFNLKDLAETDILNFYLKGLSEYNLISIEKEIIKLTEFGQEALQSKLKYKYFFASTELFENQTAIGENFDFSFKSVFDLENNLSSLSKVEIEASKDFEKKQRLQFQIFGDDIYKGEIIELYESNSHISYKEISLQCEVFAVDNSFQLSIFKTDTNKSDLQFLIDLPENAELKSELLRKGMYHHILTENTSITKQDIETYKDLWNWKKLAENTKVNWKDKDIFKLFIQNGDGSVWSVISEKAPIENIKSVIQEYAEYWNWTTLTERFDNDFIKEQIENFDWDFEELSHKETELVISLLSNPTLKDRDWDWNYLSKNLPDEFIEKNIEDFAWDFYVITESKNDVFKNTFIKYRDNLETLISKNWNWKFISEEINLNFLHKNISGFASKIDWNTILNRFFTNEEITEKCLKEESFKSLLKQHLPDNFVIAHQKYLWSLNLIDFFEQQNLIQWETKSFIKGFDTNENVEWNKSIFERYHKHITTENGFLNVSQRISDFSLIEQFSDFAWDWNGISQNKRLISNSAFIEKAFVGSYSFSDNLLWNEILTQSNFDISFWNRNLKTFHEKTNSEKQILFWKSLTRKENQNYIFANNHFPWDWTFITENCTEECILESFDDEELFQKWDWKIATRKLDKETILDNLEDLARFVDWKFLINEVFTVENELAIDNQLPRIAACLTVVEKEKRKEFWKDITIKFPFETLFQLVGATIQSNAFEWDWDYISNHKLFPTDIATLNQFKQKINWTIFSESNAIQQRFNPKTWNTYNDWENNTDKYLSKFADNWDWKVLSKNDYVTSNLFIITKHKGEKWDWEYLSEFGGFLTKPDKDKRKYLVEKVVRQFHTYIKFDFLSKRKDVAIGSNLILSTKEKNWDWQVISENEKAEISIELIIELKDKNWNWKALSKRKNIEFSNETLLQLSEKDWDWNYLSENTNLEFNAEFIKQTKAKPWNWKTVSRHKTFLPTIELLKLTKDFELDWEHLSQHSSLNPTKELLAKFENKWHWQSITKNPQINFSEIDFIQRFANKWNWRFVCESGKLALNKQILTQFKDHLEWNLISSNTNLDFTKEIIQEFKQFWNWSNLKYNPRVIEKLGDYVLNIIEDNTIIKFIDKINEQNSQWKGKIYHFSHIDNAVKIIRERKIKSRKIANQISDSAGNVVYSRVDAHPYARFYFRPHTQTQFYNEYLGVDIDMGYDKDGERHSWYDKEYRLLDFPKCPKPIYFEFPLQEILFGMFEKCYISTGNMQRNRTRFGKIEKLIHLFNFEDLFINPGMDSDEWREFREFAQQEFMIENELDFSKLNFKIICANEDDKKLLIQLLGVNSIEIINNIVVDSSYYRNENPKINQFTTDDEIEIYTVKKANGYFVLTHTEQSNIKIIDGDVIKEVEQKITFKSSIRVKNISKTNQIRVMYIDEINQEWFVFANYELSTNEFENIKAKTQERKRLRYNQTHYVVS